MIRGTVNARRGGVVSHRLRGPTGAECDVEAVIDTGYTGSLTLPPAIVTSLHLSLQAPVTLRLGDGTVGQFDVYGAEVEWDQVWTAIRITEIETDPLLGIGLLAGHELFVEFIPNGVVEIRQLP